MREKQSTSKGVVFGIGIIALACFFVSYAADYDLLIRNGTIYDGGGGPPFVGDVAINEDLVVRELMAQVAERAGEVARAAGALDVDIPNLLEPGLENYYDYMHFTPKGAERVASLIAEAMAAEGKDLA